MADLDLARRLAAHPEWRWAEGACDTRGDRVLQTDSTDGEVYVYTDGVYLYDGRDHGASRWTDRERVPNLADFATAGVVLGMVHALPDIRRVQVTFGEDDPDEWIVRVVQHRHRWSAGAGPTLGEAAARAWLAAQEVQP